MRIIFIFLVENNKVLINKFFLLTVFLKSLNYLKMEENKTNKITVKIFFTFY
jgi:hypothetical protein